MAATADSVIVELIAKTDAYQAQINAAAARSDAAFDKIEKAAGDAEKGVDQAATRMGSATKRAANDIEGSARQTANGQRNLGRQVADVGAQLSGAQSPFLIFAQQAPQIADGLADTQGRDARVAAFFVSGGIDGHQIGSPRAAMMPKAPASPQSMLLSLRRPRRGEPLIQNTIKDSTLMLANPSIASVAMARLIRSSPFHRGHWASRSRHI